MDLRALGLLERLRAAWTDELAPSTRRALVALSVATALGTMYLARIGTREARSGAAAILVTLTLGLVVWSLAKRRPRGGAREILTDIVCRSEPALGDAALRALDLVEREEKGDEVGSRELVSLHFARLLARVDVEPVRAAAGRKADRRSQLALVLAAGSLGAATLGATHLLEGANVLCARDDVAPVPMTFLDQIAMEARPPSYLHRSAGGLVPFEEASVPRGSELTVRGRALHAGRSLVLSDGASEVPFVDDGQGELVAHWVVGESSSLFIAARFGDVRVRQVDRQTITSIPDGAPAVLLEGAPRTVRLLDEPSIPLRYEAHDDHGLREVNLVLRSGAREERRVLSRPSADSTVDRGAYELRANDPLFQRSHAPVEATIEARDNDPIAGPKWGRSASIVIVPPALGEPEALRLAALEAARDVLTDVLAERLAPFAAKSKTELDAHGKAEEAAHGRVSEAVTRALGESFGGKRIKGRAARLARAQLELLGKALKDEKRARSKKAHEAHVEVTERVLLAYDAAIMGLAYVDARAVAKDLADVADEAAESAQLAVGQEERPRALLRLDAARDVLGRSGEQLGKLGTLGEDLSEAVTGGLGRITRAQNEGDFFHARLAAEDLAARLRKPDPSFQGGGGGEGGVESGQGSPSSDEGDPSDADEQADSMEQAIAELIREHQREMGEVAEALERATKNEDLEALRKEAKEHADAIRDAVRGLPRSGGRPGSAESAAAAARAQAEAMAAALEGARPSDAVESGERAAEGLREAGKQAGKPGNTLPDEAAAKGAKGAQAALDDELAWAKQALEKLEKGIAERAKADLERAGQREGRLADKAREAGKEAGGALPEEASRRLEEAEGRMREAERALREGKGAEGLEKQREAQRLLEMALGERDEGQESKQGEKEGERPDPSGPGDIPDKDQHEGPLAFRKRVLEGLAKPGERHLADPVKRYAEGLLK
jgi:hypothetical protein